MNQTCGICSDTIEKTSHMTRVCACLEYCPTCLANEGQQIYSNRGSSSELVRMLNCSLCHESKDIEIYPLTQQQKEEIMISIIDSSESADTSSDEEDDDSINRCPGCRTPIERDGGCNHMTHANCPGRGGEDVHFCDCCGTEIFMRDEGWEDEEGVLHFPNGLFEQCEYMMEIDEPDNDNDNDFIIINNPNNCNNCNNVNNAINILQNEINHIMHQLNNMNNIINNQLINNQNNIINNNQLNNDNNIYINNNQNNIINNNQLNNDNNNYINNNQNNI
jgi:hypothetical protein